MTGQASVVLKECCDAHGAAEGLRYSLLHGTGEELRAAAAEMCRAVAAGREASLGAASEAAELREGLARAERRAEGLRAAVASKEAELEHRDGRSRDELAAARLQVERLTERVACAGQEAVESARACHARELESLRRGAEEQLRASDEAGQARVAAAVAEVRAEAALAAAAAKSTVVALEDKLDAQGQQHARELQQLTGAYRDASEELKETREGLRSARVGWSEAERRLRTGGEMAAARLDEVEGKLSDQRYLSVKLASRSERALEEELVTLFDRATAAARSPGASSTASSVGPRTPRHGTNGYAYDPGTETGSAPATSSTPRGAPHRWTPRGTWR